MYITGRETEIRTRNRHAQGPGARKQQRQIWGCEIKWNWGIPGIMLRFTESRNEKMENFTGLSHPASSPPLTLTHTHKHRASHTAGTRKHWLSSYPEQLQTWAKFISGIFCLLVPNSLQWPMDRCPTSVPNWQWHPQPFLTHTWTPTWRVKSCSLTGQVTDHPSSPCPGLQRGFEGQRLFSSLPRCLR